MPSHRFPIRVYYEDTDAGGVVYYANYLRFAERARTEALRDFGVPHAEMARDHAASFMVRRVKVEYLRPGRLDDRLTVETRVQSVAGASTQLAQAIFAEDGALLATLEVKLACVGILDGRATRIPERWRVALTQHAAGTPVPRTEME